MLDKEIQLSGSRTRPTVMKRKNMKNQQSTISSQITFWQSSTFFVWLLLSNTEINYPNPKSEEISSHFRKRFPRLEAPVAMYTHANVCMHIFRLMQLAPASLIKLDPVPRFQLKTLTLRVSWPRPCQLRNTVQWKKKFQSSQDSETNSDYSDNFNPVSGDRPSFIKSWPSLRHTLANIFVSFPLITLGKNSNGPRHCNVFTFSFCVLGLSFSISHKCCDYFHF